MSVVAAVRLALSAELAGHHGRPLAGISARSLQARDLPRPRWICLVAPLVIAGVAGTVVWLWSQNNSLTVSTLALTAVAGWVIGALVFAAFWLARSPWDRRARMCREFAAEHGWRYRESDDQLAIQLATCLPAPNSAVGALHVVSGEFDERSVATCDYYVADPDAQSGNSRDYTVCVLSLPAPLPALRVVPDSLFDHVAQPPEAAEVVVRREDFARRFRVRTMDPALAVEVLSPTLVERMIRIPHDVAWWLDGQYLVVCAPGRTDASSMQMLVELAGHIAATEVGKALEGEHEEQIVLSVPDPVVHNNEKARP